MTDVAPQIVGFVPHFLKIPAGIPKVCGLQNLFLARILKEIRVGAVLTGAKLNEPENLGGGCYYGQRQRNQFFR